MVFYFGKGILSITYIHFSIITNAHDVPFLFFLVQKFSIFIYMLIDFICLHLVLGYSNYTLTNKSWSSFHYYTVILHVFELVTCQLQSFHFNCFISFMFLLKYNAIIHSLKEMCVVWLSNDMKFIRFQAILLLDTNLREMKDIKNCKQMFLAAFFHNNQKLEAVQMTVYTMILFNISTVCKSTVTESRSVDA